MRPRVLALLIVGLLSSAGCGGESARERQPPPVGSKQDRAVAQRVVDRLWRAVITTDAALPLFYDESVLRALTPGERSTVLYAPGVQFAVRPRVVAVERSPLGMTVFTESRLEGAVLRASYLLRKLGVEWKIAYDSNLVQSLDRLAGTAGQLRDPETIGPQVLAAGAADLRLREVALPKALRGRRGRVRERGLGPLLRRDRVTRASERGQRGSG